MTTTISRPINRTEQRTDKGTDEFWARVKRLGKELHSKQATAGLTEPGSAQKTHATQPFRKLILEGHPVTTPFKTPEQAERYLKGSPDGHICLICGHPYRALGIHIAKLHRIDPETYLSAYGLPPRFGLASEETKKLHRNALRETIESGNFRFAKGKKNGKGNKKYTNDDFFKVIALMKELGLSAEEVIQDNKELPSYSTFKKWKSSDNTRQSAFMNAVESLPFSKQSRMKMLGSRFDAEIKRLRKENKTVYEISSIVGVDKISVLRRLKAIMPDYKQLRPELKTHCPNGHEYKITTKANGNRQATCQKCNTARKRAANKKPKDNK